MQELEKIKQYIRIKMYSLAFILTAMTVELILGVMAQAVALLSYLAISMAFVTGLVLYFMTRRGNVDKRFAYLSFAFDILLVAVALYLGGGTENTWWFLPVFVIFIAGYIYGVPAALIFAAVSFSVLCVFFTLEYFSLFPHFSNLNLPPEAWRNFRYLADYLTGMFLLYAASAVISGYFSQTQTKNYEKLEISLKESGDAKNESENARKALLNIMEDLNKTKSDLEIKVKERTAEIEEAKSGLEEKVNQRTSDLEKSRKAILHMMKDLKEDMAKLQIVDRMKTEFLSMVSHELRTPLTPIKGYLFMLLSGKMGEMSEHQKATLETINKQSEHLHSLIDSLLDLSRLELGKPILINKAPVLIESVIREVVDTFKYQAKENKIELFMELQENLPTVMGDIIKLNRIVVNLIGNAIKFTPEGGEIRIRVSAADASIRVEVIDNGLGIASDKLEKIFEKFYQVDSSSTRAAGGMGMGLPIARELVELHGGRLWAESEGIGKGSRFIFTLPVV